MTANYGYVELNLKELKAFEVAYNECLLARNANNKMQYQFHGDNLSIKDFVVYKPESNNHNGDLSIMLNIPEQYLELNKIYKLSGASGCGKTTLLKAITNNWQYTKGTVTWPENAENNICFISQNSFIPLGTLIEILTYPLKPEVFWKKQLQLVDTDSYMYEDETSIATENDSLIRTPYNSYMASTQDEHAQDVFMDEIHGLLKAVGLLPNVINVNEIEDRSVKWSERLSGGEKQKVAIVRALLSNRNFIIMDEATSALDLENEQIVFEAIKHHMLSKEYYMVIYTGHDEFTENFADVCLTVNGQSLDWVTDNT